jgi:hypothetical protein
MITQIDTDMNVLFAIVLCLSSVWPHYTRWLDDGRLRVVQPDHYQEFRDGKAYGYLEFGVNRTPHEWLTAIADNWLRTWDTTRCYSTYYGDIHRDGIVNYKDLAVLARHWPRRELTGLAAVAKVAKNEWMCK